jgi:hypothetical protein
MCLKCKEEVINPLAQVNLIDDDFGIAFELFLFAINVKQDMKKNKSRHMLCLMGKCMLQWFTFVT